MDNVIKEVGFEPRPNETVTHSLLRQEVLHFACTLGHEGCTNYSEEKFKYMLVDRRYWYLNI